MSRSSFDDNCIYSKEVFIDQCDTLTTWHAGFEKNSRLRVTVNEHDTCDNFFREIKELPSKKELFDLFSVQK